MGMQTDDHAGIRAAIIGNQHMVFMIDLKHHILYKLASRPTGTATGSATAYLQKF